MSEQAERQELERKVRIAKQQLKTAQENLKNYKKQQKQITLKHLNDLLKESAKKQQIDISQKYIIKPGQFGIMKDYDGNVVLHWQPVSGCNKFISRKKPGQDKNSRGIHPSYVKQILETIDIPPQKIKGSGQNIGGIDVYIEDIPQQYRKNLLPSSSAI